MSERRETRQVRSYTEDANLLDDIARARGVTIAVVIREMLDKVYPGVRDSLPQKREEVLRLIERSRFEGELDPDGVTSADRQSVELETA
jgi:hypothetical protein